METEANSLWVTTSTRMPKSGLFGGLVGFAAQFLYLRHRFFHTEKNEDACRKRQLIKHEKLDSLSRYYAGLRPRDCITTNVVPIVLGFEATRSHSAIVSSSSDLSISPPSRILLFSDVAN